MTQTPHDRLRAARIEAGYESAAEAADALDMPGATYSSHENGSRGMTVAAATRYARFFGITTEWLLTGRGGQKKNQDDPLVSRIYRLPPEKQKQVSDFIAFIENQGE